MILCCMLRIYKHFQHSLSMCRAPLVEMELMEHLVWMDILDRRGRVENL